MTINFKRLSAAKLLKEMQKKYTHESILGRNHAAGPHSLILVLDHLKPSGFNIGKIFRSGNALGVHELHLVGIDFFDPRAAKGAIKCTRHRHFSQFEESYGALSDMGYTVYALSPESELSTPLHQSKLASKCAFVLGHEEFGLSFDCKKYPAIVPITIAQFGRVQSLNVSIAASIAGYEYLRQHILTTSGQAPLHEEKP
jgi:tRNA G18 (ribose-2'-O)-methylase SpoU